MGRYLSPPTVEDVNSAELKCAVIWYPSDDGLFFQNAVRGALANLRYGHMWEGSKEVRQAIVQRFIESDLKTDRYFFIKDCEVLEEAIDEDGTMAITVNVQNDCGGGCGCGGDGTAVYPDFPNPTPIPVEPLPNNPPTDDGSTIPDGFETYEEYRTYKCNVATQMVDDFTETIGNFQSLGGIVAVGAGYAAVAFAGTAAYSGVVVGLMAAGLSVTGGIVILALAMGVLIGLGAVVFDHFNDIFDELTANRNQFICDVYATSNESEARQVFYDVAGTAVSNLAVTDGVRDRLEEAVVGIIDALVPAEIVVSLFKLVADLGREDFDCSACDQASTFQAIEGDLGTTLPPNWVGNAPNYSYTAGVRLSGAGYDACTNDSFCEDASYYGKSGMHHDFTGYSGRLEIRKCTQSDFHEVTEVVVELNSAVVHTQDIPGSKYAPVTTEINYDFLSLESYRIYVQSKTTTDDRLVLVFLKEKSV